MAANMLTILLLAVTVLGGDAQKKACDPLDDGPFLATKPTLNFVVDEATQEELNKAQTSGSKMYWPELRLQGSPSEWTLSRAMDFQFLDPFEYFQPASEGGKNYLKMVKPIDRDGKTSATDDDISFIPFTLTCTPKDSSLAPTVYDARIFINDVNDNDPEFTASSNNVNITISEAMPVGSVVLTVTATDKDANLEGNMTYSLLNNKDKFSVDPLTGEITLTSELDYEGMGSQKVIDLEIEVKDGGPGTARTAKTTAHIKVSDANDQGPAFVYDGCFKHMDVCAWPKYTTELTLKKDQPIKVLPVPNKVGHQVPITAMDLDQGIGSEIKFSIASTIPPGHESEFQVSTTKGTGNEYVANIAPVKDMVVNEGFEIFLKAEEQSPAKRHEVAMIFFTGGSGATSQGQGSGNNSDNDDSSYSDREVALIVVVAILASLLLCSLIGLIVAYRRRSSSWRNSDLPMGTTNNGFSN